MKNKTLLYLLLSILVVLALSACQSSKSEPAQPALNTETVQNTVTKAEDEGTRPEYLPADFPLPDDAKISTSHSEINDGKKSALLIFSTEEDMATITKLYKDYFKTQNLDDSGQTLDEKNIVIQGDNPEKNEGWSVIGGLLSTQEGIIELNVTWTEL